MFRRWILYPSLIFFTIGLVAAGVFALTLALLYPNLPGLESLTDYKPRIPLRVYTAEGSLIGEFGDERRAIVKIETVPELMKKAILAAEDDRFYEHSGVDYTGVMRAALANVFAGGRREGASTITMQVARNFFLTREKTITRKLSEMLLAFKIERNLSKDQIFELYINQIFLGQRAYGFAAAGQIYFAKKLDQLNLSEIAALAGLPKAPSKCNPINNAKCANQRALYVLRRMRQLKYITDERYEEASKQPARVRREIGTYVVPADYIAEMARQYMFDTHGEAAYESGFKVVTTIRNEDQENADQSLRKGILDYDRRHGYRGPEGFVDFPVSGAKRESYVEEILADREASGGLQPAVVLQIEGNTVQALVKGGANITLQDEGLKFAQAALRRDAAPNVRLRPGAIIRVIKGEEGRYGIAQLPIVEAALVAVNPNDGAIRALAGGFDFHSNKFNHVTQAMRQPGSSFKPFVYSAALEKNFTTASIINDAPLVIDPGDASGELWEPKNFDNEYSGPTRLRTALAKSKNMVSIRIMQSIGGKYAQDYVTSRFGFDPKLHPPFLTMALGAGNATPLQMATAYCVFANNGYKVRPYFIERVLDQKGNIVSQAKPVIAAETAEQTLDPRNAFLMNSLLRDVVRVGTAARAMSLGRRDLAGKTGTTNEHRDAWFAGYHPSLVAIAWIGFDNNAPLGDRETGSVAALPMWMSYMGKALRGVPEVVPKVPQGIVQLGINPETGKQDPENPGKIYDYFYLENVPAMQPPLEIEIQEGNAEKPAEEIKDQLF
ncbi:MAG: penicillin-binding protein 1A [Pseudomonadota bacterium]|nr:penicillin-binding protein 1A [Pseudomonadota bacterium]